jgi:hypothetical protein
MDGPRVFALARVPHGAARSLVPYLSTIALLGLTLGLTLAALGPSRFVPEVKATHLPALIRELHATASGVEDVLLFEATFTPGELPVGEAQAVFYRLTLQPGTSLAAPAAPYCLCRAEGVAAGVGIEIVQSGTYSLQMDSSLRVQRATASVAHENVVAGREILLGSGDAVTIADYAGQGTIRNAGDQPVVVLGMAVVTMAGSGIALPPLPGGARLEPLASSQPTDWANLPPGPVAVSLWRLRLPASTSVGPYAGAGLEALSVESGMISRGYWRLADRASDVPPLQQYIGAQSIFLAPAPGIRRSITAGTNEPAVLLALSIEPEAVWSATLAP